MSVKNNKNVSLETILNKFDENNKKFINQIKKEEELDSRDNLSNIINTMKADSNDTERLKKKYIKELLSSDINKIKEEGSKITVIKKSLLERIKIKIINFLNNF